LSDPKKLLAALDGPPGPRPRHCGRCETLAEHARTTGLPLTRVHEVESWMRLGVRYHGALCRECADWEWSAHWVARFDAAGDDLVAQRALDRERQARLARGRRYLGPARPSHHRGLPDASGSWRATAAARPKTGDCP